MDRAKAKHIIKHCGYIGNEVGVAFDVAIKSMDKLEKIEQIVSDYGLTNVNLLSDDLTDFEKDILREVLEQE